MENQLQLQLQLQIQLQSELRLERSILFTFRLECGYSKDFLMDFQAKYGISGKYPFLGYSFAYFGVV